MFQALNETRIKTIYPTSILFTSSNVDLKPWVQNLSFDVDLNFKKHMNVNLCSKNFDQFCMTHKINLINQWRVNCIKEVINYVWHSFLNSLCMKLDSKVKFQIIAMGKPYLVDYY